MSTKKYNVGIIGYGWAATAHIDAINATSQAQVTAIYSSRPLDSATLSAKHGGKIKAYQSVEALLADPDIHVVDITSYPSQHCAQAVAAAKAKKHIILEKADGQHDDRGHADLRGRREERREGLRLLRVPLLQPDGGHQGRHRPRPHR